jgi:hypothetical protein
MLVELERLLDVDKCLSEKLKKALLLEERRLPTELEFQQLINNTERILGIIEKIEKTGKIKKGNTYLLKLKKVFVNNLRQLDTFQVENRQG